MSSISLKAKRRRLTRHCLFLNSIASLLCGDSSSDNGCCRAGAILLGPEDLVALNGRELLGNDLGGSVGGDLATAVKGVEVLVKSDLENGRRSLASNNHAVGEEVRPDAVPAGAVLGGHLVLVGDPVLVPPVDGGRVVNTENIGRLDLKARALELVDNPAEVEGRVRTGEHILVHENAPDEVLKLPALAETSDLENKDSVVGEEVVDLAKESTVAAETNVLSHLEARNLVVVALLGGDLAVVHAEDAALRLGDTVLAKTLGSESSTSLGKSNTSDVNAVVLGSVGSERSPTTANVEHAVSGLEVELVADHVELIVLELLKSLLAVNVTDNTRSVDHTGSKEPRVKVVSSVVVVTDLVLVLALGVEDDIGNEVEKNVAEVVHSELEARPVVALLHNIEDVTVDVNLAVKVGVVEGLHGHLLVLPLLTELGVLDGVVLAQGAVGKSSLLVDTGPILAGDNPVANGQGHEEENEEDDVDGPRAAKGEAALNEPGHKNVDSSKVVVVERSRALGRQRGIRNRWVVVARV